MRAARLLFVLLASVAAGCGGSRATEPVTAPAEVRHQGLYYLGESFDGLPLTHAESSADRKGFFVYGTCEPPPGSEGGCAPPLQVQNFPLARRHPSMFEVAPGTPARCRRTRVRGVPAAVFETTDGALEVYAGETVVVVSARPGQTMRAARALRRYGSGGDGVPADLPAPPSGVEETLRRCASE